MAGGTLNLDYVSADELTGCLEELGDRILMLVGFGAGVHGQALPQSSLWVDIPILDEHDVCF